MMRLACQERLLPGETLAERWDNARRCGWEGIELHGPANYGLRERLAELRSGRRLGGRVLQRVYLDAVVHR